MTEKLLGELQERAQGREANVLELLSRAKVLAVKLAREDARSWIEHELNGYPDGSDVPPYRVILSELKVHNPYHGWNAVAWSGQSPVQEHFASAEIRHRRVAAARRRRLRRRVEVSTDLGEPPPRNPRLR